MAITKPLVLAIFSLSIVLAGTTPHHQAAAAASDHEACDIGFEAYLYLYPLVSGPTITLSKDEWSRLITGEKSFVGLHASLKVFDEAIGR